MLTPFTEEKEVDYEGLGALVEWYLAHGASGLFAVTQSSEMFFLSLEERRKIAAFVKEKAAGRVPVIASGHIGETLEEQVEEVLAIAETGVDAVILVTNRLAREEEGEEIWLRNLQQLLSRIPEGIKLGLYECPYPYKRVMSETMTAWCAASGRFYFLKDTCCDRDKIRRKLELCEGSRLRLYNANTATLLESLRAGAAGYSGVMANMQCTLYEKLCADPHAPGMEELSDILTICALMEKQWYPCNAKYYLQQEGLPVTTKCRVQEDCGLTETFRQEIQMLRRLTGRLEAGSERTGGAEWEPL